LALACPFLTDEDNGMNPLRLLVAVVAGCGLFQGENLRADAGAPPFAMDKQYSADMTIMTKGGMTVHTKTYVDGDKLRSNLSMGGIDMATIVRKDQQKVYQVIPAQKMVMEMNFDPSKFTGSKAAGFGPEGSFVVVGPDTIGGVACTKYKVTSDKTKEIFYMWLDLAGKTPVQMAADDGSFTVTWKNYKAGPQDASLFEVPADYQVMPMPSIPGMPGGDSGGGQ
jgi:hypothetical protein